MVQFFLRMITALLFLLVAIPASALELLVPAYFYPGGKTLTYWDQLVQAAPRAPLMVILNPSSGPGATVDPKYLLAVNRVRAAGGKVLGYVATGYGVRAINQVSQDILNYQHFYPVDGIFLDEMANDGTFTLSYYASLYQYIKGVNNTWRVIGNPGANTLATYLTYPTADGIVMFEDTARVYQRYATPVWAAGVPTQQIGHLVTNVADFASARSLLKLARQRNAGMVYFTSDKLSSNPWNSLPAWWSQLVAEVCLVNGGTAC